MSKKLLGLTAALLFAFPLISNGEEVGLSDVQANGSINATAAHGVFDGNDTGAGNPLLTLLNDGGDATLTFTTSLGNAGDTITIGSGGLFNTDLAVGTPFDGRIWKLVGKSDGTNNGPFTSNPGTTTGTLTLDTPVSGNVVISLKASNAYAVYAFQNLTDVSSFAFNTRAFGDHALSHATMFVPEPTSFIMFATVIGLGAVRRRRGK